MRTPLVILMLAMSGYLALGAGQASASHVSCGDTITADTTLDGDLVDCPSNGIVIGADGLPYGVSSSISSTKSRNE